MTNKIVSSLTDEELRELSDAYQDWSAEGFAKQVANAAAQRAIEELAVPKEWIEENYPNNNYALQLVFQHYLKDLKEGKL